MKLVVYNVHISEV